MIFLNNKVNSESTFRAILLGIKKEDNESCPLFVGDDGFEPPTLWV